MNLSFIKPWHQQVVTWALFLFFSAWWLTIFAAGSTEAPTNFLFGTIYGFYPFLGVLWGLMTIKQWGGFKSLMGMALIWLTLGMFGQAFGQSSFSFMVLVLGIDVPYPSFPDIGYFGSTLFYIFAGLAIAKASGISFSLKRLRHKAQAILIPALVLIGSYYYLLAGYVVDWTMPAVIFFDFAYPLSDAIAASLLIVTYTTTIGVLGGKMKPAILLVMSGFAATYFANFVFIVLAENYFPGSFIDFLYLFAYFLMSLALIKLRKTALDLRSGG